MKSSIHYIVITIAMLSFITTTAFAQPEKSLSNKELAKTAAFEAANKLKINTLVVRLRSGTKKKLGLETLLKDKTLTKKQRKYIQKQLDRHITSTKETNESIMKSFKENYSFSKILFMYDTNSMTLYKNLKKGYFLNSDLTIDPAITLTTPTFYTCDLKRIGTGRELEGFVIQNAKKEEPKAPFPAQIAAPTNPGKYIWNSLIGKKSKAESYTRSIMKLNGRLYNLK